MKFQFGVFKDECKIKSMNAKNGSAVEIAVVSNKLHVSEIHDSHNTESEISNTGSCHHVFSQSLFIRSNSCTIKSIHNDQHKTHTGNNVRNLNAE